MVNVTKVDPGEGKRKQHQWDQQVAAAGEGDHGHLVGAIVPPFVSFLQTVGGNGRTGGSENVVNIRHGNPPTTVCGVGSLRLSAFCCCTKPRRSLGQAFLPSCRKHALHFSPFLILLCNAIYAASAPTESLVWSPVSPWARET